MLTRSDNSAASDKFGSPRQRIKNRGAKADTVIVNSVGNFNTISLCFPKRFPGSFQLLRSGNYL